MRPVIRLRAYGALAILVAAALVGWALPATAQVTEAQVRDSLRAAAVDTDLARGYQALTIFGSTPGISAARFDVDDGSSSNSYKATPSRRFDIGLRDVGLGETRLHVEGSFSYLRAEQSATLTVNAPTPTRFEIDSETFTVLGGIGADIVVGEGTSIRPIFLAGYSRTTTDQEFTGPEGALLRRAGQGVLFDANVDSTLYGGALELVHERTLGTDIKLQARARYNHIVADTFEASDPVLETSGSFGVVTGGFEFDGPTPITIVDRAVRWIAFSDGTWLTDARSALGFDSFVEVGGGIRLVDVDAVPGIGGIELRGSYLLGPEVDGWSVGLSIAF
ncbi:hypothetical protein [Zavarzinia sp. CC-PAN008]|uniref:hypothetical protein n=1 Tax=Zavarzinia sp. CC-PAN008 TaxID=3243332 RepID=UPI003F746A41